MKAFQNIRTEMRETCTEVGHPPSKPQHARIVRLKRGTMEDDEDTAIEPWMEAAFHGLAHASETGEPFALISCFMNGEPAAVIAATHNDGRRTHVMPLFLACQPWMNFASHAQHQAGNDEDR